jgi:ADP-heptose:LPS heptosyltransferase
MSTLTNILVSRLRFMGDVILTTPVLHALKQRVPEVKITYLAESPYHALLEDHPWVDRVLCLDRSDRRSEARLIRTLVCEKYDAAIDLFGNPRSALLIWLSGARIRIGGNYRIRKAAYTHRIKGDGTVRNAVDFHMQFLEPLLGRVPQAGPTRIQPTEAEKWRAIHYLAGMGYDMGRPVAGLHPGASWPAKRWPPGRFADLADRLQGQGIQVLFTMGPGEDKLIRDVLHRCKSAVPEPRWLPVRDLAAVIDSLNLYISNDCGPMHIGPAVGTRTLGLFGPGEPEIWFPYRPEDGHRVIHHEIGCSRCHRDVCDELRCMDAIRVDEVFHAALEQLK